MCGTYLNDRFITDIDIKSINSATVYECRVRFNKEYYNDDLFASFEIQLPNTLICSGLERKAEFLAGRIAAKEALKYLGVFNYQVLIDELRQPIWPKGLAGSITHTQSIAICSAASIQKVGEIGIDAEHWIDKKVASEIQNEIVTIKELFNLSGLRWPFNHKLTLCFSIKESLYKALSAFTAENDHYYDLEIIGVSPSINSIQVKLLTKKSKKYIKGYVFFCGYTEYSEFITTRFIGAYDNEAR